MANDEETVLEFDDDFLNPGPVRALSRTPSHISQSNFFQASQAREVAQDGDIDGEAAEAMRATGDDFELEEDFGFYLDDSRVSPDVERPPDDSSSRTAHLRSIATQQVLPAHAIQSNDQVAENAIEGDLPHTKKQKLTSEDEDGLELEIEDEFDYLQSKEAALNHEIFTSTKSNLAAVAPDEDQLDELEMEDDFKEILHSNPSEHPQGAFPLETHSAANQIFLSGVNPVSDPATRDSGPSDPDLGVSQIPSVATVQEVSSATGEQPNISILSAEYTVASSSGTTLNPDISTRWASLAPVTAVTFDGRQVCIARRRKPARILQLNAESEKMRALQKQSLELLDEPVHRMLDKIRMEKRNKPNQEATAHRGGARSTHQMTLWTDRYKPTKFIDLIGDERVFRNAMSWLKEWDQCVFKHERSAASRRRVAKKRSAQAAFAASGSKGSATNFTPDPLGRPQEKVLLLCGAPGLGKTTMAHVLAQQAGYDVVEINASDDRTSKVVTERIKSALETRTLDSGARQGGGMTFKDNRPTCVIIDEIDGASGGTDGGFVKALVKLITDGSTVKTFKARGKKAEIKPLVRPIICICNDLYAPTLRPLRPIARIIRFTTPSPMTIIKRLQTICDLEKLKADLRNLTFLVKIASGDLRSCLNTLQAVQSQSSVASESAIKSAAMVGMKDVGTSVQSILSKIFKLPKKAKEGESGHQLSELIQDISTCGEFDRILQGCFEFYLSAKRPTDLWATYESVHEWLNFSDRLDLKVKSEQSYGMMGYSAYAIAAWRELMGKISNTAPEYPRIDYEMRLKAAAHQEFFGSFKQAMPPLMRVSFMTEVVISELIPHLMRIISPDLRPVNSQLIRREERDVMMRVVNIMLDLGLKLIQDKGEDGQLTFVLDPPIDLFTQYEGKRPQDIPAPRYGVRQMIAREMDLVLIKRNQGNVATADKATSDIYGAYKKKVIASAEKAEEKVAVDFFGRLLADSTTGILDSQGDPIRRKATVLYRYHEGFSNAVKRPLKFSEFLMR